MANPSRFNKVGLTGRPSASSKTDGSLQGFVSLQLPIVASTAEQNSSIVLPTNAIEVHVSINVLSAEVTGTTKTLDIGIVGNPDLLIDAADVSSAALVSKTGGVGESAFPVNLGGETITYALGSADFVELEAEVLLYIVTVE